MYLLSVWRKSNYNCLIIHNVIRASVCVSTCLIVFLLQVQDDGTTLQYNPYSWNMVSIGIVFYVCNSVQKTERKTFTVSL